MRITIRQPLALLLSLVCTSALAGTNIEFRKPSGEPYPAVDSVSLNVPNNIILTEFDDLKADLTTRMRNALLDADGITQVYSSVLTFPDLELLVSGEGTRVIARISGIDRVHASVKYKIPPVARVLCGWGTYATATVVIDDLSLALDYNYYTGDAESVDVDYSNLDVDVSCNSLIGNFILGPLQFLAQPWFTFEDFAVDKINDFRDEQKGNFSNLFSLEDALQNLQVSGRQDIQEAAQDALGFLGGVRSSTASFISNEITDALVVRLNLQTQSQINALNNRLAGLDAYISARIPQLATMSIGQLNSANFDLSNYLNGRLPGLRNYLINQLNGYYGNAVAAVNQVESQAIQALEDFVGTNWARIFGGVNVRLSVLRAQHKVIVDVFHDAPIKFEGIAEAMLPCVPNYTVAAVENAARYRIFDSTGSYYYQGLDRTHLTYGLLQGVIVKSHLGLSSYATPATIRLVGFGDYPGGQAAFVWPQCQIAGSGGGGSSNPPPPPPPPGPPNPPPPGPPGGHAW